MKIFPPSKNLKLNEDEFFVHGIIEMPLLCSALGGVIWLIAAIADVFLDFSKNNYVFFIILFMLPCSIIFYPFYALIAGPFAYLSLKMDKLWVKFTLIALLPLTFAAVEYFFIGAFFVYILGIGYFEVVIGIGYYLFCRKKGIIHSSHSVVAT